MWSQPENDRILSRLPRRYLQQQADRMSAESQYDHLLVFGYQCKLYRNDDKARVVNTGQQLIPWMGDDKLMIDRYDVRGHLHDLSAFEPKSLKHQTLTAEEKALEAELNTIRYADLKYDLSDEPSSTNFDALNPTEEENEEKSKRFQGQCIPYNYDANDGPGGDDKGEGKDGKVGLEAVDDTFTLPSGVEVPEDMVLPESAKLAAVIEKTAEFVSKQNAQMEILLKAKQASNPSFHFLDVDSKLYPFYKFVLQMIKDGNWPGTKDQGKGNKKTEKNVKNGEGLEEEVEEKETNTMKGMNEDDCSGGTKSKRSHDSSSPELGTNSDSDSEHYLHPSLLSSMPAKKKKDATMKTLSPLKKEIPKIHGGDSKYSRILKELKSKYTFSDEESDKDAKDEKDKNDENEKKMNARERRRERRRLEKSRDRNSEDSDDSDKGIDAKIPEDTKKIIEKLAESVAKNGDKFEAKIHALKNPRFAFLSTNHEFHLFYIERKIHHFKLTKLQQLKDNIDKTTAKTSFSLAAKNEKIDTLKEIDYSASALVDEAQVKEKTIQIMRRQKAAEFLKSLKSKGPTIVPDMSVSKSSNSKNVPQEPKVFGPELPTVNLDPVVSDDDLVEEWIENLDKPNFDSDKDKEDDDSVLLGEGKEVKMDEQPVFKKKNRTGIRRERLSSRSRSTSPVGGKHSRRSPRSVRELPYKTKDRTKSEFEGEEMELQTNGKKDYKKEDKKEDRKHNKKEESKRESRKEDKIYKKEDKKSEKKEADKKHSKEDSKREDRKKEKNDGKFNEKDQDKKTKERKNSSTELIDKDKKNGLEAKKKSSESQRDGKRKFEEIPSDRKTSESFSSPKFSDGKSSDTIVIGTDVKERKEKIEDKTKYDDERRDKDRDKNRDKDRDKNRDKDQARDKDQIKDRDKNRDKDQHQNRDKDKDTNRDKDQVKNRDKDGDKNRDRDRDKNRDKDQDKNRDKEHDKDKNRKNKDDRRDDKKRVDKDRDKERHKNERERNDIKEERNKKAEKEEKIKEKNEEKNKEHSESEKKLKNEEEESCKMEVLNEKSGKKDSNKEVNNEENIKKEKKEKEEKKKSHEEYKDRKRDRRTRSRSRSHEKKSSLGKSSTANHHRSSSHREDRDSRNHPDHSDHYQSHRHKRHRRSRSRSNSGDRISRSPSPTRERHSKHYRR